MDKAWGFNSNGHCLKIICDNLYFAFNELAWIAHSKLEKILQETGVTVNDIINSDIKDVNLDMSIFIPTLKIASQYVAHKNLRRAFSKFWSSKTEMHDGKHLPPTIKTMKYHLRKGFYNLLHHGPETVSVMSVHLFVYHSFHTNIHNFIYRYQDIYGEW